ncbi:ABC transporter substrate-binding protein [Streptomyces sp. B27]|uniref:ABC transporter substrate-binding protein n=1 Tax=Streptomyces sp. B27 TaxID=2485015 RepID=UPI000FD95CBA|nr:ABC transporter substrate-binding protein [Streptomyces sp. B27]
MLRRTTPLSRRAAPLVLAISFLLAGILPLPAAQASPSAPAATRGGDYRIGHSQPIDSVNPLGQQNVISNTVSLTGYDMLLNFSTTDGRPDPETSLADSYETSPDGRTWTFRLRPGITWSDGQPLTSADVRWTYRAIMANQTNVLRGYVENIREIEAPDPSTVVFELTEPDARLESAAVPILPEHVFAKYPVASLDTMRLPLPAVTTAPFRITSYKKNGTTVLETNPRFRGDRPAMGRVVFVHYQSSQAALRDISLGSLDMIADGDSSWVAKLKDDKNLTVWTAPAPGYSEIAFNSCPSEGAGACTGPAKNVRTKVVQDPAIRRALAWGIDRANLSQTIYAGQNAPADGLISPYYSAYYRSFADDPEVGYGYDPDKARAILRKGGWDCTRTPCVKDGTKAEFEMQVRATSAQDQNAVRRIRAWAQQIGITVTMSVVTEDALNNTIYNPGSKPDTYAPSFESFYWAWSGDIATPDLNLEVLRTSNSWSDSYYSNPEYDRVSLSSLRTLDFSKRVAAMQKAQRIALTDLPYIPTVFSVEVMVTRKDTWHAYQASPSAGKGSPFGTSWTQLTALRPGPQPGTVAASGTPGTPLSTPAWLALTLLTAGTGYALGRWRRPRGEQVRDWTDE